MSVQPEQRWDGAWAAGGALYLMTKPTPAAARRLYGEAAGLKARHSLVGRPTDWDRLHVTLGALWPDADLRAVDEALSRLEVRPFQVVLDRIVSWKGGARRPLVATSDDGVLGLLRLHEAITAALDGAGVEHGERAFTPHVTLLRDPATVEVTFIDPVSWTAPEVQLVLSFVEARRHVVLRCWRLGGV